MLLSMENTNPIALDFVLFCSRRYGLEWPDLYDEMCWVAGHRLYKGMGYTELAQQGISFHLEGAEKIGRIAESLANGDTDKASAKI